MGCANFRSILRKGRGGCNPRGQTPGKPGFGQLIGHFHGGPHAAGVLPGAWAFATGQYVAHNEAGLRGMAPQYGRIDDPESLIDDQWDGEWNVERSEPFPEQYDTFVGSAASLYHFAPVELNREHLVREGYPEERVPVVGNSVVDAIEAKAAEDLDVSVFDEYPVLEERDDWIRVDVHRRANLLPGRFRAIVEGVVFAVPDVVRVATLMVAGGVC